MSKRSKRTHRYEKLARIYDKEILPIWSERFGRMLLRDLELPATGQVLDVTCGTGYPAVELLRRMGEGCRLIAIDPSSAMLDVARRKVADTGRKGVFFRTESARPRLSFADDVYDLVVSNLGLADVPDAVERAEALADLARVTRPGGQVRCTLPLAGTFEQFYDIFAEVLVKHDKHETLERLNEHLTNYPTAETCHEWLAAARLERCKVDVEEFSLLFKSSREFFFAPVIDYGPLSTWKKIAGGGQELQDIFWYIKEAIDAYFSDRAFEVTVRAGCLSGFRAAAGGAVSAAGVEAVAAERRGSEDEDTDEMVTDEVARLSLTDLEPTADGSGPAIPHPAARADSDAFMSVQEEFGDVELDAFVEGRARPEHLDE